MKLALTVLISCLASALQAANEQPLQLLQTIPLPGVKGRFDHFSIDTKGQRLFVAALGNNTLEVIDLAAGKLLQTIPGMAKPQGVLYVPGLNQILVANGDDASLKIFGGDDYRLKQSLPRFDDADNLRLDAKNQLAWLGYGEGGLAVIDIRAAKLLGTLKLPAHPESFQVENNGPRMFVNIPEAKQVAIVDRASRAAIGSWPMEKFQQNFPMALDAERHRLFVGCRRPPRLIVVDTATGTSVADVQISGDTDDLFYDSSRNRLYISCGEGFLDVIQKHNPEAYERTLKLPTKSGARTSFFSEELDRLYLAVPARGQQGAELRIYKPQ